MKKIKAILFIGAILLVAILHLLFGWLWVEKEPDEPMDIIRE